MAISSSLEREELNKLETLALNSEKVYRSSIDEGVHALDLFHGRKHLDAEQVSILENRGQPKQIHNIIREFAMKLAGYLSATRKEIDVKPTSQDYSAVANVTTDVIRTINQWNDIESMHFHGVLRLLLTGISVVEFSVKKNGKRDKYGRPYYDIVTDLVPHTECFLDPWSRNTMYKDAGMFTRRKWVSYYDAVRLFGADKVNQMVPYESIFSFQQGYDIPQDAKTDEVIKESVMYEVIHTSLREDTKTVSYHWNHSAGILKKEDMTYKNIKFPYMVQRLFPVDNMQEYYGVFRDLFGTQDAINHSIIAMQHMLNTSKVIIEDDAVKDLKKFVNSYNAVNGVAVVNPGALKDGKVKIQTFTTDLLNYQNKVQQDIDRAQRSIPINDAFQGLAPASDSGLKVQVQQQSVITGQTYAVIGSDSLLKQIATGTLELVKQYWTAEQVIRVTEGPDRDRWVKVNSPVVDPLTGDMIFQVVRDPETDKPMKDEDGKFLMAPMVSADNTIGAGEYELLIKTRPSGIGLQENEDMIRMAIQGTGQIIGQMNPADVLSMYALLIRGKDAKNSEDIAKIIEDNATILRNNPAALPPANTAPVAA